MIHDATPTDVFAVAPLMLQAMEGIVYKMAGEPHEEEAVALLAQLLTQKGNRYSYGSAWAYEEADNVVESIIAYDGAQLHALCAPVLALIRSSCDVDIVLEDETAADELYIDTLGVLPRAQRRGIGSKLVRHPCEVSSQPLGLLVDMNNPEVKHLYNRLGFEYASHQEFAGGVYRHLILKI